MASIKYRCLHPNPKTVEYPVTASQYFQHNGLNLVYQDGNGRLTGALTAQATIFGIVVDVPKGRGNTTNTDDDYWLSSATEGADKLPVILAEDGYEFLMPGIITTTVAMLGGAWDHVNVNTASTKYVDLDTSSTDLVIARRLGTTVAGGGATDVVIVMNPLKIQADT